MASSPYPLQALPNKSVIEDSADKGNPDLCVCLLLVKPFRLCFPAFIHTGKRPWKTKAEISAPSPGSRSWSILTPHRLFLHVGLWQLTFFSVKSSGTEPVQISASLGDD